MRARLVVRFAPTLVMVVWALVAALAPDTTVVFVCFALLLGAAFLVSGVEVREWREWQRWRAR